MLSAEQVAARKGKIGGSDAAVCCGLSDRITARELYHIMREEVDPDPIDPIDSFIGHQMEPMIAQWVTERTGKVVRNYNRTKKNKRYPWAIAHPDRVYRGERRGLEIKTRATPEGWGEDDGDLVPDDVELQCRHYMEVFEYDAWDVAVFFLVAREFRIYHLERDAELGAQLMRAELAFMEHLKAGTPPEWDFNHPTTLELMKLVYPGTNGRQTDLPADIEHWWAVLEHARKRRSDYHRAADAAKAHILEAMGEHSLGFMADGYTITQKRSRTGALILSRRKLVNYY